MRPPGRPVVEERERARPRAATPARVALAWVVARPGITSTTIIGARTPAQLDDNLASLEVELAPDQVPALDALSAPALDFPAAFLRVAGAFMNGGTTINGESTPAWPMAPKNDGERY
ncbi:aldo/keto reductase [Sorangium sp. So ce1000]|uniref:aldo/keto reductase n=1 Tax=Sorangium sp. So ce1000 TaxID=3133325 RepID=UPI003F5F7BDD